MKIVPPVDRELTGYCSGFFEIVIKDVAAVFYLDAFDADLIRMNSKQLEPGINPNE